MLSSKSLCAACEDFSSSVLVLCDLTNLTGHARGHSPKVISDCCFRSLLRTRVHVVQFTTSTPPLSESIDQLKSPLNQLNTHSSILEYSQGLLVKCNLKKWYSTKCNTVILSLYREKHNYSMWVSSEDNGNDRFHFNMKKPAALDSQVETCVRDCGEP